MLMFYFLQRLKVSPPHFWIRVLLNVAIPSYQYPVIACKVLLTQLPHHHHLECTLHNMYIHKHGFVVPGEVVNVSIWEKILNSEPVEQYRLLDHSIPFQSGICTLVNNKKRMVEAIDKLENKIPRGIQKTAKLFFILFIIHIHSLYVPPYFKYQGNNAVPKDLNFTYIEFNGGLLDIGGY
jgi:hypothetical protein